MRHRHRESDEAIINITPMLDIVFIMLIFFIVTTSFVSEFGIDVNRPADTPVEVQDQGEVIAVRIDDSDRIYVEDRLVDIRGIRANIESGLALQPQAAVVVIAAMDWGYGSRWSHGPGSRLRPGQMQQRTG